MKIFSPASVGLFCIKKHLLKVFDDLKMLDTYIITPAIGTAYEKPSRQMLPQFIILIRTTQQCPTALSQTNRYHLPFEFAGGFRFYCH